MAEEKKKKKWMKKAFENAHGQFREKAERAGETTSEFAKAHDHDKSKTGKQARLAEVGMSAHHVMKKMRHKMYGEKNG